MASSPHTEKTSMKTIEALRGEHHTTEVSGTPTTELVCYNNRSELVVRIPSSQIITVLRTKVDKDTHYHILHVLEGENAVLKYLKSVERFSMELVMRDLSKDNIPPMLLRLTKMKSLPGTFLAEFPPFQGFSNALRTFCIQEVIPRYDDPDFSNHPNIHVLLSEHSGTGLAKGFYDFVLGPFLKAVLGLRKNIDFDVHKTTHPRDHTATNFARDVLLPAANQGKKRLVILCSGDGGIVDLLNGPLRQDKRERSYVKPTICLIPLGTGNALFHSLHRPLALTSVTTQGSPIVNALRTLLTGNSHPLPTFTATFSPDARLLVNESREAIPFPPSPDLAKPELNVLYGAVVASYGFHATLVAESDTVEYRKHGHLRFGMVAEDLISDDHGRTHHYECDVKAVFPPGKGPPNVLTDGSKTFCYILCTLVSNLESTFTISPASQPLDGVLRTVSFGAVSGGKIMQAMSQAYQNGRHVHLDYITYRAIEDLRIDMEETAPKWRKCCVDGQIVLVEEGGWMDVGNRGPGDELLEILAPEKIELSHYLRQYGPPLKYESLEERKKEHEKGQHEAEELEEKGKGLIPKDAPPTRLSSVSTLVNSH